MFPWIANLFASPSLLWWLGLAGAPLVIHLLHRRKFRETQWAAMKFLLEAARKNSRRLRVEQLLLLLVRTLLILLALMAVAEPLVNRASALFQSGLPVHRIVIIDASASMGATSGDETLFHNARRLARDIVERSRQGDAINLVRLSTLSPRVIVQTPALSAGPVLDEIDRMELSPAPAGLLVGLEEAVPLLRGAPEIRRKEVYLLSDFQRATWDAGAGDASTRLRGVLKKLTDGAELVLIDVGEPGLANAGVNGIESLDPVTIAGRGTRVRVSVRNFSSEALADRELQLLVDDRLVDRRTVNLAAGAETSELFNPVIDGAGEHRIEARLGDDSLPVDNRRWLAVSVKDRLRVLCVNGRGTGRALAKSTDFLALALSPAARGGAVGTTERSILEPTVVNESELASLDLSLFDCVFYCDVKRFTEREATAITTFLKQGGGVIFCAGDQVQAKEYNDVLYKQGAGVLPAKIGERQGDPVRRESIVRFDPGEFGHPLIGAFQGNPDAGLESTVSYAYLATSGIKESGGKVALRFDDGQPAILEKSVGLGKSVLITTSLDDQWSLWPLWPSYVPLIQEIAQFAVAGRAGQRQKTVGDSLEASVPAGIGDTAVEMSHPNGEREKIRPISKNGESRIVFGPAIELGIYEARIPPPSLRTEQFAVNFDSAESNLTKYTPEELREGPLAGIDATLARTALEPASTASESVRPVSGGLTRPILYLLLYLLFVEQALAWNFSAGLWLLCPPLALYLWWRKRSGGVPA